MNPDAILFIAMHNSDHHIIFGWFNPYPVSPDRFFELEKAAFGGLRNEKIRPVARFRLNLKTYIVKGVYQTDAAAPDRLNTLRFRFHDRMFLSAFCGRIFNLNELKNDPTLRIDDKSSISDDEFIARCHMLNPFLISSFNGKWSFVSYDPDSDTLFLCRDKLGLSCLYYYTCYDNTLFFSSDLKLLLKIPEINKEPNWFKVCDLLLKGGAYGEEPEETFYQGIFKVPPACCMEVSPETAELKKYWNLDSCASSLTGDEIEAHLLHLLKKSVSDRLPLSVKQSCFTLSGGLDSSALALIAAAQRSESLKIVSIFINDFLYNERGYVQEALKKINSDHIIIFSDQFDFISLFEEITDFSEEPVASPAWTLHSLLFERVKDSGAHTIFLGHGLDEIAAGYPEHVVSYLADMIINSRFDAFREESEHWSSIWWNIEDDVKTFVQDNLSSVPTIRPDAYFQRLNNFIDILNPEFLKKYLRTQKLEQPFSSLLKNRMFIDLSRETLPPLLKIERILCRKYNLEHRLPFLDENLIEFLIGLPDQMLIKDGFSKYAVRRSLKNILPDMILQRRNKIGFNFPFEKMSADYHQDYFRDILDSAISRHPEIFQKAELRRIIEEFQNGDGKYAAPLFRVSAFHKWITGHF